jgi:hypothetical protein
VIKLPTIEDSDNVSNRLFLAFMEFPARFGSAIAAVVYPGMLECDPIAVGVKLCVDGELAAGTGGDAVGGGSFIDRRNDFSSVHDASGTQLLSVSCGWFCLLKVSRTKFGLYHASSYPENSPKGGIAPADGILCIIFSVFPDRHTQCQCSGKWR